MSRRRAGLPPEQQKIVNWLNSPAGVRWSREKHSPVYGNQWFSLKRDIESPCATDLPYYDDMSDVVHISLGGVDDKGKYQAGSYPEPMSKA